MKRGWRAGLLRRWPLAVLLVVLSAGDLETARGLSFAHQWWALPGAIMISALAVAAPRRPVASGVGVFAVLLVWSAVLRLLGAETVPALGPLLAAEVAALMATVVVVVRQVPRGTAAGLVGLLLAGCIAAQVLRPRHPVASGGVVADVLLPGAVLLSLAVVAGWYLRGRDSEQARVTQAAVVAAQQRERVGLARELHDVVAHYIGGMVVQAQAAQAVAGTDPGAAARVLPAIEGAGTEALSVMRRMVAALRDGDADGGEHGAPLTLTTNLTADLHAVTVTPAGGTPVRLAVELAEPVPVEIATSVLRLVQESVTNARRHAAGANEIAVMVRTGKGLAQVLVRDDGRPTGKPKTYGGGYGLLGMRERVQLLGGRFSAGASPSGGWQVTADVPLRDSEQ
ncbi:sensor histidine kinase [Dactylosporangium sp. McL0621]|uniref:sensor histidine kinase n=1 Tax=Dactylosporangium sp. McL0621 TaxID=3415678 RepID=UPI003CF83EB4